MCIRDSINAEYGRARTKDMWSPAIAALACLASVSAIPVLSGYDVVEYKSLGSTAQGVQGSSEYACDLTTYDHGSVIGNYTFYFKDGANLNKFKQNPLEFVPAYGGF
eukprot:TRINITY_DN704_c0_g1_i10.p1 TRINITY_DN704_c0_g1~~TRINITY_DN704_c0_g1_i10.p1  ORF type:complete len:107 (+),score=27.22 TRINITY_DN704_c0_g1_i10:139-459(+)